MAECPPLQRGVCAVCSGPSGPRRCCSPSCARQWSESHVWASARLAALVRAGYQCESCQALDWDEPLEVHHRHPVDALVGYRPGCQHHADNLEVACRACHRTVHARLRCPVGKQMVLIAA